MDYFYVEKTLKLGVFCTLIFSLSLPIMGQEVKPQKELYGERADALIPGARYVLEGDETTYPSSVKFARGNEQPMSQFTPWLKKTLEMPSEIGFEVKKSEEDDLGYVHYRLQQTYDGIPVDRGEYVVQSREGNVTSFNGEAFRIPSLNTEPAISEKAALEKALESIDAGEFYWEIEYWEDEIKERTNDPDATYYPEGELVITKFGLDESGKVTGQFRLAYAFDIHATGAEARIYVDAETGALLYSLPLASNCEPSVSFNSIFNGSQSIQTEKYTADDYRLNDDCDAAEVWVRDWGSTNTTPSPTEIENTSNTWTTMDERFGASVLWETKESYDYFLNVHSRSSYDDADGDLNCYINAWFSSGGTLYNDNASMSFDGSTMKVGLGSSGTLANSWSTMDIIAHEFTHAVSGTSSGLVYQGESGALNESFSDIFGDMVENYAAGPNDWLMGDDRTSGAIRSLSNPKAGNDPDTYMGDNWANTCGGCSDNGGVHTNSGVQNYWFYLLSEGGSGTNDNNDDYDVNGIGKTKASAIAFRNMVLKLSSNSDYADARAGSIEAAEDLYGTCSNEVKAVTDAWYAVGVGDPYVDVSITVSSDISCFGADDGSIDITAIGTAPFTYEWMDGPTTEDRTGLSPGVYVVTVTDATGCEATTGVLISEPDPLSAFISNESDYNGYNVSCFGGSDGFATASANGGTNPFSYEWSDGQMTATATGLSAGTYDVTITDANGCTSSTSITITEPPLLTAGITDESDYNGYNISCNGGSDGWATVTGQGGAGGYSYEWSDGQMTATAVNLSAGMYSVTITDGNGCEATASITMTEPPPLTIEAGDNQTVYYGYPPAECATISWSGAGGGVPPYTIEWNDGGSQTHEVCPGEFTTTYTVSITDANDCVETDEVTICVIDVRCGNSLNKVELCHVPEEDPLNIQTLCVSVNAVANHLDHGDELAACGTDHSCPPAARIAQSEVAGNDLYLSAYPNPFIRSTTLSFSSEQDGAVRLELFDHTGRLIGSLFDETLEGGKQYHHLLEDLELVPGLYICILHHENGSTVSRKLLVQ